MYFLKKWFFGGPDLGRKKALASSPFFSKELWGKRGRKKIRAMREKRDFFLNFPFFRRHKPIDRAVPLFGCFLGKCVFCVFTSVFQHGIFWKTRQIEPSPLRYGVHCKVGKPILDYWGGRPSGIKRDFYLFFFCYRLLGRYFCSLSRWYFWIWPWKHLLLFLDHYMYSHSTPCMRIYGAIAVVFFCFFFLDLKCSKKALKTPGAFF